MSMTEIGGWIVENRQWLFSGLGIVLLGVVAKLFLKRRSGTIQTQRSGDRSVNIQSAGNLHINNSHVQTDETDAEDRR